VCQQGSLNYADEQPHRTKRISCAKIILCLITKLATSSFLFVKHQSETSTFGSRDERGEKRYDEERRTHGPACKHEKTSPWFREDRSQSVPKLWNW